MNCTHVLGLIDAGPFAGYPRAHLDAAWRHADACDTCGPALSAAAAMTTELAALPRPAPPRDLTRNVLARIAHVEAARATVAASAPVAARARTTREWPAWPSAGAMAAAFAIVLLVASGHPLDIVSPRAGGVTAGLISMPATTAESLALAAGLALYVAGLFASVGATRQRFLASDPRLTRE